MQVKTEELPALENIGFTKRVLFVDCETSGFQSAIPDACVLSIGAVLMETDGTVSGEFYGLICPSDDLIEKMSPGATEVNGLTADILRRDGRPASDVWKEFADWLKEHDVTATKTRYIGQNPGFDIAFITAEQPALAKKYGWTADRALDIIKMYMVSESKFVVPFLGKGRKGKNGNGIANAIGVDGEPEVHNALEGAKLNYRNYTRLAQIEKLWRDKGGRL